MARLDEIFDLQMGKTPSRNNADYWTDGQYDWVSIADLGSYQKYVEDTKERISALAVQESGIKSVPANTVIMSFKLSLGKTAITQEPVYTNEAIMAFIPTEKYAVLPDYFYYLFSAKDWTKGTNRAVMGTTLNKATLGAVSITVPPIDEQRKIAAILDKVSDLIAKRQQQLDKLDEAVKARFVEIFGDCYTNPHNLPIEKWNNIFSTTTGKLDSNAAVENGKYPFFTCSKETLRINTYAFDQEALLLAGNNAAGKYDVKYYCGKFNAYQRTYVLSLKHDWSYALFRFQLEDKLGYLEQQSLGGLTKYLTLKILNELEFIVPPKEEQDKFAAFVDQIEKTKTTVSHSLEKLETLKKALMQEYFR